MAHQDATAEARHDGSLERRLRDLERENERLERLVDALGHDLRNQLAVAVGRLELARRERDDEDLAAVATALERMEALLEDLPAGRDGGLEVDGTQPVSLADRARRCWEAVAPPGADLVVESSRELEADPERLEQLLQNLLGNAVEHARPGECGAADLTVTVGVLPACDGFFVEDDGRGLPAADRESLFEPGVTTAEDGHGLGLAIVEDVAEAHGWRVEATESRAGGARFEIAGVDTGFGSARAGR